MKWKNIMKLVLACISKSKAGKSSELAAAAKQYLLRAAPMCPADALLYPTEDALLSAMRAKAGRTAPALVLFDSRGGLITSELFAAQVGALRDSGVQLIYFAIGPASGWSAAALDRADRVLSLGRMTLPHELARVVVAEQIYRALTILAGHPYHCGH